MAYGTNAPFGLRPLNSIAGGSWTEKVNEYEIYASADGATTYATSIFTGDPVQWGTSMGATPAANGAIGTIARFNPTFVDGTPSTFVAPPILGVFVGCVYEAANSISSTPTQPSPYWPASAQVKPGTKIKAYIIDDPNVLYDIQISTSIDAGDVGAGVINFIGRPFIPNVNPTGGGAFIYAGTFGRNFALNVAGGTNFDTILPANTVPANTTYANNPANGSTLTAQSAFYLDASTSTAAGTGNNHDYAKNVATLALKPLFYTLNPQNQPATGATMASTPFLNVTCIINNHVYGKGSTPPVYVA